MDQPRVGVGEIDRSFGQHRRGVWLGVLAHPPAQRVAAAGMKLLIGLVGRGVDSQLLLQTAFCILQAFAPAAGDRVSLSFAVGLQLM
jgi:hypothetical protein